MLALRDIEKDIKMNEADQLKKLMEAITQVGEPDPMTGELEQMPEEPMVFDWKTSPETVINTLNKNLAGYGIQIRMYADESDTLNAKIVRVDY